MQVSNPNGGKTEEKFSTTQVIRWVLCLVIAGAFAIYYFVGVAYQPNCHQELSESGTAVQVCGPPDLSALVPALLGIGLFLAPDLSELGISGLLSVKRKVAEQDVRQSELAAEVGRIEQRVAIAQSSSANVDLRIANEAWSEEATKKLLADLGLIELDDGDDGGKADGEGGAAAPEPQPSGPDDKGGGAAIPEPPEARPRGEGGSEEEPLPVEEEVERAELTVQLLHIAKNLGQFETISRRREVSPQERMAALTDEQQQTVDRWYSLFAEEIRLVRQVRNLVAHRPYAVGTEELREATRVGRQLLRDLLTGIGASTEEIERLERSEPNAGSSPSV